jgi:2-amino-4-hydroxy-6-hydroxymethyldihydropteridine diphosphokinase
LSDWRYLVALGSNVRHHRYGRPDRVLRAALAALPGRIEAASPIIASPPLGPSRRRYANAALVLRSPLAPEALLDEFKAIERAFGRCRGGQRWSSRVLDLDIVLWSGGAWASADLTIPHPAFRTRKFVLGPASAIAPDWRDPVSRLSLRQLLARLMRPRPLV